MAEEELGLIDAHCHLDETARRGVPVERQLEEAHRAGVHQVVTSGDGLGDSREAAALAGRHPEVFFTVGWHPHNRRAPTDSEVEEMRQLMRHPKAVAVGEIGLDYHRPEGRTPAAAELQREVFAQMLELAWEERLPVVIHHRQAPADLLEVLDRAPAVTGMLHCFSGGVNFAAAAAERGLMCSFAGNVTFKSAPDLQGAARVVPAEHLLVETDSPFLAPVPYRGDICRPALVRATASWVAVLRGECLDTLAGVSSANARTFFNLPAA